MKNIDTLPSELKKLGLSEKEAGLYLVALELGHASVQEIAKKSLVTRPTVYRILDSLEKKELVRIEKKKHSSFIYANSPDELLALLRSKKRKIEEQEREFLRIISLLKDRHQESENGITVHSAKEGAGVLLDELGTTHAKEILVVFSEIQKNPTPKELEKIYKIIRKRLGKISVEEFHSKKITPSKLDFVERKTGNFKSFPATLIISDKVLIFQKNQSLNISQKDTVQIIKSFFKIIWNL